MKPNLRFLLSDPTHFVALGFGSGLFPKGPGTAGTLLGWILFPFVYAPLSDTLFGALLVACFLFGIIACERTCSVFSTSSSRPPSAGWTNAPGAALASCSTTSSLPAIRWWCWPFS